jgi:hypothetical protein
MEAAMGSVEFRANAEEHLDWARTARTDRGREIFLQMAKVWLEAAARAEEPVPLTQPSPTDSAPDASVTRFVAIG